VSQENVEVVLGFQPGPDMYMTQLFRDDDIWAATSSVIAPRFHADYECVFRGLPGDDGKTYPGMTAFGASGWIG
jgi:hypothetical protein